MYSVGMRGDRSGGVGTAVATAAAVATPASCSSSSRTVVVERIDGRRTGE